MNFFEFELVVKHDAGKTKIVTVAQSIEAAVRIVMAGEKCPERAILSVKRKKEIG